MPKRSRKPAKPLSAKQQASDDELRALLRHVDMDKFTELLKKAVAPTIKAPATHERR